MPDARTIETIHDVTEEDVENAYQTMLLVRGLRGYAEGFDGHERTFNPQTLDEAEMYLDMLWQSLAVIVANKREAEIGAEDIINEVTGDVNE